MFRFTIRDVLWLMVVVGLAVSWWMDRYSITKEQRALAVERKLLTSEMDTLKAKLIRSEAHVFGRMERMEKLEQDWVMRLKRTPPLPDAELARLKDDAARLGAPQPKPLPPEFGERPNEK